MRYLIGVVFIVVGFGQFALRDRIARANAASNKVMYDGRFSGRKTVAASRLGSAVAAVIIVIMGILILAGVFHIG